jgi:hypothetical protein
MKSIISAVVILVSLTSVGHAQVTRLGRAGELLRDVDIAAITRLAATADRKLWLVDGDRGQVLPETWTVYAYLAPRTTSPTISRGAFVTLESLMKSDIARRWRVTSRSGQWARVALSARNIPGIHDEALNRPFQVRGRFSDAELVSIVEFIRSSPRKPPIPDSPDGTIHREIPDEVSGHLPISSIAREKGRVVVTLRGSRTSWEIVTLEWIKGQWRLREITNAIA